MPEKETVKRSRKAKRAGRSATTQASPYVREEIHHVREGKHGARSTKQAIAIGLAAARRASARKAVRTKGPSLRRAAARKAARTRKARGTQGRRRTETAS